MMFFVCLCIVFCTSTSVSQSLPPPDPEPIEIVELPLPPVSPSRDVGACTAVINPHGTGCIARDLGNGRFQAGDFTPNGENVIVTVEFVGAPSAPNPASAYSGEHLILIKADGTKFSNGDPWKCLSCVVPSDNAQSLNPQTDYPHVFRSGDKAIWGQNILECDGHPLGSDSCTPDRIHIYPIFWQVSSNATEPGGTPRELRVHPDDEHIGWSSFTGEGGQTCFLGRLEFNANPTVGEILVPRYELVDVNLLVDPKRWNPITADGLELHLRHDAITVGELRGFSGDGAEITYIGASTESSNIDLYAVHMETGVVRRLTSHPDYADPVAFSASNEWFVTMDTRVAERQMWMSGMRGIPPLVDIVAVTVAASTRNNGPRRFFQPIMLDYYGDRASENYYGQQINAAGSGKDGSVNDPNWNGRADPAFSLDSTQVVYWQAIVTSPSCGGSNPLPCPNSTAQGGREYRVMLARFTDRRPKPPAPVYNVPKQLPWAISFPPGVEYPSIPSLKPGNYTLQGAFSGQAQVSFIGDQSISRVVVNYTNYSDDGDHVLNGWEDVALTILYPNYWKNKLDWYSDIVQTGIVNASKTTSPDGFHVTIDAMVNVFNASGTLTTIIDGKEYHQPANGA
ncbi:saponin hydrolase precursor [Paraphoma chrysanthemicola]|uniref:Saponin hydrolase n=1 Tax=Paraphoma chrysanthemicola TaxID=798071 RepID=A0A8K0VXX2_9PLEO|nr:saponin hydrolase precursor [Paraphoma chrysanthemicola]